MTIPRALQARSSTHDGVLSAAGVVLTDIEGAEDGSEVTRGDQGGVLNIFDSNRGLVSKVSANLGRPRTLR